MSSLLKQKERKLINIEKPKAILLDIEGTTSDIGFVSKTLFPFIKQNVPRYFREMYDTSETQEMIQRLRDSSRQNEDSKKMPQVAKESEGRLAVIRTTIEYALNNINKKMRTSEIKQLQILVWVWGYEKGLLKGHVYDDVTPSMHIWKHQFNIDLYIFSSGMIAAQQLLLCCTNHGNCLPLISAFFDSSIGDKTSSQSYKNIARQIKEPGEKILFITDNTKEAKAAIEANFKAIIIKRANNRIQQIEEWLNTGTVISSFEDIKFN